MRERDLQSRKSGWGVVSWCQQGDVLQRLVFAVAFAGATSATFALPPNFTEQTNAVGLTHTHSTAGFTAWNYTGGGTVGDFNNNGWLDLFVISGGSNSQPDRLFINNGDGTFTNQAAAWGLTIVHRGKSATAADFDSDGWVDLYVTSAGSVANPGPGRHKLYRNTSGSGTYGFTDVAPLVGVNFSNPALEDAWTACFGDYDLDGDLDLFVGGFRFNLPSNNGNRLFRNNLTETGDANFTDVTATSGDGGGHLFAGIPPIATLAAGFADMDGDGYPELLIVGDFKGANYVGSRYFRNNTDGTFTDITVASNTGHEENGMGMTLGDFMNNGLVDWYVTSIHYPPMGWTGNKMYYNFGNHTYVERAAASGVAHGYYGWGAIAVDFNHNGLTDLAATNGDGTVGDPFGNKQSHLWQNNGMATGASTPTFTEVALPSNFAHFGKGRALLHFDINNDGRQDIVLMSNNEPLAFYRNDLDLEAADTNWLRIFLDTSSGASTGEDLAPNGYGAKVYVTAGSDTWMRQITGSVSYLGISELSAHFGLGGVSMVDELRVEWAKGDDTVLANVPVNQTMTLSPPIAEPPDCPGDVNGDNVVNGFDLVDLLGCWGPVTPRSACEHADLDGNGVVNGFDLVDLLGHWGPCDNRR